MAVAGWLSERIIVGCKILNLPRRERCGKTRLGLAVWGCGDVFGSAVERFTLYDMLVGTVSIFDIHLLLYLTREACSGCKMHRQCHKSTWVVHGGGLVNRLTQPCKGLLYNG